MYLEPTTTELNLANLATFRSNMNICIYKYYRLLFSHFLNSTRLSRRVDKLGGSRGREEEEEDEEEETLKLTTTLASDI